MPPDRSFSVAISRLGVVVTVERPDGTAATNEYGKVSDTDVTWSVVGEEPAVRSYQLENLEPTRKRASGGTVQRDNPEVIMLTDTDAQIGDRITFPDTDKTYVLDSVLKRRSHTKFETTLASNA